MSTNVSSAGLLSYNSLVHAISGSCGSAVAMAAFFPLDTVRTRLQLQAKQDDDSTQRHRNSVIAVLRRIYLSEGMEGLYRGLVPVLQSLACSNFVYFYSFHGLKRSFNPGHSATKDLLCGMVAGVINVLSTTPLWVVNTRLKMQGTKLHQQLMQQRQFGSSNQHLLHDEPEQLYKGLLDGLVRVFKAEGWKGLWSGCGSSLMLVVNPAIQFMVYEAIKRWLVGRSGGKAVGGVAVFAAAAAAKAVATTLTYPIQLAQARQRHGGRRADEGAAALLRAVVADEGATGLFRGLRAKLMQTVLVAALMFVCYEKISAAVFLAMMGRRNRLQQTVAK